MAATRASADDILAAHLASGRTVKDAAALAGVSENTAYRRARNPEFQARVRDLRSEMVSRAMSVLADGMVAAAATLRTLVQSGDDDMKYKAAVKVIELTLRIREQTELEDRLAEVERRLAGERDERDRPLGEDVRKRLDEVDGP